MNSFKMVECSHELSESTLSWPGGMGLTRCPRLNIAEHGFFLEDYKVEGHIGTHIDSPGHVIANGRLIHELTLEELRTPGVVIDVKQKCAENPDYELSVQDLLDYEEKHGRIPGGALVCMRTGWGAKANNRKDYMNFDEAHPHPFSPEGTMHFPGFSAELGRFLCEQRSINGIGIDTLSLDPGVSTTFEVHRVVLGSDKYMIENMYLEDLPESGFTFLAIPLKMKGAPEMMARIIAFVS